MRRARSLVQRSGSGLPLPYSAWLGSALKEVPRGRPPGGGAVDRYCVWGARQAPNIKKPPIPVVSYLGSSFFLLNQQKPRQIKTQK